MAGTLRAMGRLARIGLAVLVRPALWLPALGALVAMAPRGWWRHWPPVPRPDPHYLAFRLQTQYGDPAHEPAPADVVTYLTWRRGWHAAAR